LLSALLFFTIDFLLILETKKLFKLNKVYLKRDTKNAKIHKVGADLSKGTPENLFHCAKNLLKFLSDEKKGALKQPAGRDNFKLAHHLRISAI